MNKIKLGSLIIIPLVIAMLPSSLAQAQAPYFQAVTNLNPVGYWPMHEVEAAAHGDIETNYGSAGPLANGYYADWASPSPTGSMIHGWPGAIAGDPDVSLNFNCIYPTGSGAKASATNYMIIPHTSPAANLVPPFSVELWYFQTNNLNAGHQSDLFSSVNANNGTGLNGISAYSGIRLYLNNNLVIYSYNNNGGVLSANSTTTVPFGGSAWTHVVLTVDAGTNMNVYMNGANVISNFNPTLLPNGGYAPNYWDPFEIDTGKGFTRDASGYMDEIAIYTNALSGLDISNHYATGINLSPTIPYKTLVLNDNPSIYYRMDSPAYTVPSSSTLPGLTNYGSSAVNGFYEPGVMPGGVAGPNNGQMFAAGFGANTNAMPGNGMSSFADAGYASTYNPTGPNAFSVSAWFKGDYCDSRTQTIVGHGATSWGIAMTSGGHLQCQLGTNAASGVSSAGVYNDSNWHQAVEVYTPNSTAGQPGTNALYVDGILDNMTNSVTANGILPGTNLDVMIGADPQYTNNPAGLGRQFAGNVCEVALFASALTSGQIQNLYNAAEMPPFITTQPISTSVSQNSAFTNSVVAGGSGLLSYQWYTNGVAIASQTNASLILNPVQVGYASTNYYVVVTNSYGSITSAAVSLTVNSAAGIVGQFPVTYTNLFTLYAGVSPTFTISASGALPIYYQWFTNGVLDAAVTNASLTLTNVQVGIASSYCIVSNFVGSVTSMVWSASVIADPPNPVYGGFAPYPQAVLALNPIAYWRMNEPDDNNSDGDPNVVCHDYVGGNDAIYTNVNLGGQGYSGLGVDSETAVEVGNYSTTYSYASSVGSNVDFAVPAGSNAIFSVETWVSLNSDSSVGSPQGSGIVCKGAANGGEEFALDVTAGGPFRFFVRNAGGTQYSATGATTPQLNKFYHLVGVCDEAHSNVTLYVNGVQAGQAAIPPLSGINNGSAISLTMGARTPNAAAISSQCFGYLNDVAVFNYALSSNQIANEYLQSGFAPYFSQEPSNSLNIASGSNLLVTATAVGSLPITYQWYETNAVAMTGYPVAGQTNATLVISNILSSDSYYLMVTNSYGTTNSVTVAVGVYTGPMFTSYLPIPYINQFTLYTGTSPTFSATAVSLQSGQPVYYQWYTNGIVVAGATGTNLALANLPTGLLENCYCVASNLLGSSTSFVWSASVVIAPTNPYPQAVLSLHPIGYWRLDEPDDGLGDNNAGVITHDYVGGNDGVYTNMFLGGVGYTPPASYSASDPNSIAPCFGFVGFVNCDSYGIAGIDFSSPSNTSMAFSVEAWMNGYQQTKDVGLVAKGYGGGGEQFDLDTGSDGGSPSHSFRFLVRDASGTAHSVNSSIQPGNVWHHLVGVCDEPNGLVTLYIDGQSVGSAAIPTQGGILVSTSLMSIGSRFSTLSAMSTNTYDDQFVGFMNDVAVFNYALTATQVTNEYQGIINTVSVNQNPTNIVASISGNQLKLTWPADHTGWQLQVQTNNLNVGLGTNWSSVSGSASVNQVIITTSPTNGAVFYRLVYPPSP